MNEDTRAKLFKLLNHTIKCISDYENELTQYREKQVYRGIYASEIKLEVLQFYKLELELLLEINPKNGSAVWKI